MKDEAFLYTKGHIEPLFPSVLRELPLFLGINHGNGSTTSFVMGRLALIFDDSYQNRILDTI